LKTTFLPCLEKLLLSRINRNIIQQRAENIKEKSYENAKNFVNFLFILPREEIP